MIRNTNEFINTPCITARQGLITGVCKKFCDLTYYNLDELLGKPITFVFYELLRINLNLKHMEGKTEAVLFTKHLEVRHVFVEKFEDPDEDIKYYIDEIPDSRFENKNMYLEQLSMAERSGIAVYSIPGMILLKANQSYLNFLQPPFNQKINSVGKTIEEIIIGWKDSRAYQYWQEAMAAGRVIQVKEHAFLSWDKDVFYWDYCVVPIYEKGKIKYIVENVSDVTDRILSRKHIEEQNKELRYSAEQLKMITENMSDVIIIYDNTGSLILINAEARRVYPHLATNTKVSVTHEGFTCYDLENNIIPVESLPARRVLKGERVNNERIKIVYKGKSRIMEVNAVPIFDEEKGLILAIVCHRDITELMNKQQQLLKEEKEKNKNLAHTMKMKDEFLATISHEFKTPLTVINAAVHIINNMYGEKLPEKVKKHIQKIRINSFRQLRLVNNLLDITKFQSGHMKIHRQNMDVVFLVRSITESVHLYAKQKGIVIEFYADRDSIVIAIDDEKLERILLNLLSNAIKFTPKGKRIYVHVKCEAQNVMISVKDEGVGIPKDKHKHIFERFGQVDSSLTRQAEGTGIGLSLVHSLIRALGGNIVLESEVGVGSTFTVILPMKKSKKSNDPMQINLNQTDSRVMQAVAIEFSDLYYD